MTAGPGDVRTFDIRTAGAVLCGGRSTRMGRDKATLAVDGIAMAARVADALRRGGCERVVGIGGDPAALRRIGLEVVPDRFPGDGPLGGIITALTALLTRSDSRSASSDTSSPSEIDAVLVTACDLPWLTPATVAAVRRGLQGHADAGVAVAVGNRVEPLCALWRASTLPILADAFDEGERAVHRALDCCTVVHVAVDASTVANVNSTVDLGDVAGPGAHVSR